MPDCLGIEKKKDKRQSTFAEASADEESHKIKEEGCQSLVIKNIHPSSS
jgi:hypothetical protein